MYEQSVPHGRARVQRGASRPCNAMRHGLDSVGRVLHGVVLMREVAAADAGSIHGTHADASWSCGGAVGALSVAVGRDLR